MLHGTGRRITVIELESFACTKVGISCGWSMSESRRSAFGYECEESRSPNVGKLYPGFRGGVLNRIVVEAIEIPDLFWAAFLPSLYMPMKAPERLG
jgi:hypothetical protein